jgi:hypothetical protein
MNLKTKDSGLLGRFTAVWWVVTDVSKEPGAITLKMEMEMRVFAMSGNTQPPNQWHCVTSQKTPSSQRYRCDMLQSHNVLFYDPRNPKHNYVSCVGNPGHTPAPAAATLSALSALINPVLSPVRIISNKLLPFRQHVPRSLLCHPPQPLTYSNAVQSRRPAGYDDFNQRVWN